MSLEFAFVTMDLLPWMLQNLKYTLELPDYGFYCSIGLGLLVEKRAGSTTRVAGTSVPNGEKQQHLANQISLYTDCKYLQFGILWCISLFVYTQPLHIRVLVKG